MKTYLQRLAERAEGSSLLPPLSPVVHGGLTRESESDSLVEEPSGELFAEAQNISSDASRDKPVPDSKIVEPMAQPPPRVRPRLAESSLPAETPRERAAIAAPPIQTPPRVEPRGAELSRTAESPRERAPVARSESQGNESADAKQLTPPREKVFSERVVIESGRNSEREPTRELEVPSPRPHEENSPHLSPVRSVDMPVSERATRIEGEGGRDRELLTADVLRRLLPTPPVERADHPVRETARDRVGDTSAQNLEPRLPEPVRPIATVADEPRLVIGQLRVDILPAVPTQTREAVSPRQRRTGASQTWRRSQPVSKLRFGLGQM
jgi:hypothetical protein